MAQSETSSLKDASEGLLYPSETDAPFDPVDWGEDAGGLNDARIRRLCGQPESTPVERGDLDSFFAPLLEGEQRPKAEVLKEAINAQLEDVQVIRVGKINIDAYIVGKTKEGRLAGLKTNLVET